MHEKKNDLKARLFLWHCLTKVADIESCRYAGEIYEGKHHPVITKRIFDTAQKVLRQRVKPKTKAKVKKPFFDLFSCAECGMGITAEIQKGHTRYRCTKKRGGCSQPYVRGKKLDCRLFSMIQKFSLPEDWVNGLREMMKKDEKETAQSSAAFVQEAKEKIRAIQTKLQRFLDGYLDQDIERETYLTEKAKLLFEKKSLEEQSAGIEQNRTG